MTTQINDFELDNRSLLTRLTAFQAYCQTIPFGNDGAFWDEVFFNGENTPQALAARFADPTLEARTLPPQLAFLLAFMRMMETPRRLLNCIPARHRQLYYRGGLGLSEQPAQPDTALVTFQPEAEQSTLYLPEGLVLTGGQDSNGTPRLYSLQQAVFASHARWSDLRWLRAAEPEELPYYRTVFDAQQGMAFPAEGVRLLQHDEEHDIPFTSGRLVVSPLLLSEGEQRFISINYDPALPEDAEVLVDVSTKEGWVALTLAEDSRYFFPDEVVPAAPVGLSGYTFAYPVLRIINRSGAVPSVTSLTVTVNNMAGVQMRTDSGLADVEENSYPFGSEPLLGAGFQVMSEAWCNQNAEFTLTLKPEWQGLPDDFATWYSGYQQSSGNITVNNSDFKAQVYVASVGNGTPQSFFDASANGVIPAKSITVALPSPEVNIGNEHAFWRNAPRIVLAGRDFLHRVYRQMLVSGTVPDNPPYDPQFRQLVVDYAVTATSIEQYVLTPFGYQQAVLVDDETRLSALYFGFSDIEPGQQLNLYWDLKTPRRFTLNGLQWQYLAKTENVEGLWRPLVQEIDDQTDNFSRSGGWRTALPDDATSVSTLMPSGRYWLRAQGFILDDSDLPDEPGTPEELQPGIEQYPWLNALYTNAGTAQLANGAELDSSHFTQPLPAGSISDTDAPFAGLASVKQPLPTWGGSSQENEAEFIRRVTMRLGHRGRASSWRDISALLLERFPEVHHIRLPGIENLDGLYQPAPEEGGGDKSVSRVRKSAIYSDQSDFHIQTLMIVPRAGYSDSDDPLRPMLNPARLVAMQRYIMSIASPWLELRVLNPEYLTVRVQYSVAWKSGVNAQQGQLLLDEAIKQHFMPWRDEQSVVELGNTLTVFDVMQVLQHQPYVDHVIDVKVNGGYQAINTTLKVMIVEPLFQSVQILPKAASAPLFEEESHHE
ncbi:TPA: hypothetical protein SLG40_003839 [Serratia odorifera]|nr:hypothetical protein [Serratia odorifera]